MQITIVGGGSRQWGPKLVTDLVTTPSLAGAQIVLHDIDAASLVPMEAYARRAIADAGVPATVRCTTDRRTALAGADYVVVTISTGGFASMARDLEVPARFGIKQSVGDTCGPGGINRSLRNVPVLVAIAQDMEAVCPDALLLNLTNPMTCLTRSVNRETSIKAVGLCHEVTIAGWMIAFACGVSADAIEMTVTGVNHLPWITELSIEGDEGFERLRSTVVDREESAWFLKENALKLAMLDRFGALPGAGDRHVAEFFPGVLSEEAGWGDQWGIHLTSIADREKDESKYRDGLTQVVAGTKPLKMRQSGELVAPLIDSLLTGTVRSMPLNIPNAGQAPYLPHDVVVETMCTVDADGIRGRDAPMPPAACAAWTRRHVDVQELTVAAAVSGDRSLVYDALALDPLAGRIDWREIESMADQLIDATAQWLPQFA